MFKRVTTFLTVLFLGLVLTVRSPVKADTFSIPFSSIPDLINAFYTIAAGGKIEISSLIGNITGVDDFLEGLNRYYSEHYTPEGTIAASRNLDFSLSALSLLGQVDVNDSGQLIFSASAADLANFMGYDVNWTKRYVYEDGISINPDVNYLNYLEKINGSNTYDGFYWKDFSSVTDFGGGSYQNAVIHPFYLSTWFVPGYNNLNNITFNNVNVASGIGIAAMATDILNIYINSVQNNLYSYSVSFPFISNVAENQWNNQPWNGIEFRTPDMSGFSNGYIWSGRTYNVSGDISASYTGSLDAVLNHICDRFKNANIYVDGVLWSYVGTVINDGITLNDPVNIGTSDNITYNTYPIDGIGDNGIDLYNWAQSLYDYVVSNPDGTVSMDTVIEGEWDIVDSDTNDGTITNEDEEDVYKVIHGNLVTNATPTPTPDIGDPPVLKIIPPILELPDEIWPDGGRDTTVLAQMVHATDVVIPNDIMTVIWSTIGLLVVGGLISILHK